MERYDFMLVGVGGQGTLLASDVLAGAGLRAGFDVKKSEVHGMAQRGGSVTSHVRWGPEVHSPLVACGQADVILAFEKLEAARYAHYLRPGGHLVVNDHAIPPVAASTGRAVYPSDAQIVASLLAATPNVHLVPGMVLAQRAGAARTVNMVLIGVLSRFVALDLEHWLSALQERVPPRSVEVNRSAFVLGREATLSPLPVSGT